MMPTYRLTHLQRAVLAGLTALAASGALAQTVQPDAGQTLRQLQQLTPPARLPAAPTLSVPPETDTQADATVRFAITAVNVEGNTLLPSSAIQPLVAGLAGREATLGELREAASHITQLYRTRGFVVARAFVPAQEIRAGAVRIVVLEGSLSSTSIQNGSIVHTPVLQNVVAAQALQGKSIRTPELDRELLLIADLPAMGAVNGILKPGKSVGASDLAISAAAGKSREGDISLDNYGNRYTGQTRLNGHVDINSPARIGDRLSLRATYTNEKLLYGRAVYDLPVNGDGWRVGANLSSSHYELGREFTNLDADGTANTIGLQTSYPVLRGLNANVWVRGALEQRKLKDRIRSTGTDTHKSIRAGTVEAYGDVTDAFGGGAYSTWRASAVMGQLDIDTPAAYLADQAGPHADGSYRKFEFGANRQQALSSRTSAVAALSGQWAPHNLDSSEKFVLGGIQGVRAYPQGEGVGDDAWLVNLELRQGVAAGVQAGVFYDHGHVRFNHDAYAQGANGLTLKGAGLSLAVKYRTIDLTAALAWRRGQAATSAPDRNPRLWIMASNSF
ncbi:hemolysin activation/secretion protein [Actimicrobium sp. GrIS 1.19]|uniref:ShlB/FhaC/HecB family hemolysin secretion/activation protein n=1 Tax=Actimicrobium sp. GrIS 1.19 TaxID=3071708 RepID=UPI002DFAB215|nr:hemolysin activation/secretion protein [Actimicrobium sp. GrIS 1.19]